jgi:dolichyl-phosphate beta-glucosyltransferase
MENDGWEYNNYERWRDVPETRPIELSVVVPTYNEQDRLVPTIAAFAAHMAELHMPWELIVADDGSTDATRDLVELIAHANVRFLEAPANAGKGAAVRRGMLAARGSKVLFSDADNATPAQEIDGLLAALEAGADVAVGSRSTEGSEVENRSLLRRTMTAGLRTVVKVGLGVKVRDTQCGFKLFTAQAAQRIANAQTIEGFSFDLEVLYLAERFGYRIAEVPVHWHDAPGSKVNVRKEVVRFVTSIGSIRVNALTGKYRDA